MITPSFGLFLFLETLPVLSAAPTRIYGGEIAKVCEFPTTIAGRDACTATLVHPRVVLSAAHCGRHREFLIGEYKSKAAKRIKAKWCESGPSDAQICVLAEPLEDIPFAPIIQGCESDALKAGTKVLLAGYGYDENDPVGDGSVRDEKRWVETEITKVLGQELYIGGGGKTACNGDSGGPAFLKLEDGTWRTVGATYAALTGGAHPNCKSARYKRTDKILPWYKAQLSKHNEKDINLTPCFDESGAWKPTKACGGYTKDVQGPYGAWSNNCGEGVPVVKYSATCGKPYAPNDEEESSFSVAFARKDSKVRVEQGAELQVKAKLEDSSEVASVSLRMDDELVEKKTAPPFVWTLEELELGEHALVLQAKSKSGDEAKSDTLEVEVYAGSEDPSEDKGDDPSSSQGAGKGKSEKKDADGSSQAQDPSDEDSNDPNASGEEDPSKRKGCSVSQSDPGWLFLFFVAHLGMGSAQRRRDLRK